MTKRSALKKPVKSHVTIRSELRALEVLEYFSRISHAGKVTEIANAINCPQSTMSRLLAHLADAGYLIHDRRQRSYQPSARVALLSVRTMSRLFGDRQILAMLDDLALFTGGAVLLTARNEAKLHVVHIILPPGVTALCYDVGLASPLADSASGRVLLAKHSDSFILALLRRYNAEVSPDERLSLSDYLAEVNAVRRDGYIIYPLADAARMLAKRCRLTTGRDDAQCCLMRRGPYLAMPVDTDLGEGVVVLISLPAAVEPCAYADYADEIRQIIGRHMH